MSRILLSGSVRLALGMRRLLEPQTRKVQVKLKQLLDRKLMKTMFKREMEEVAMLHSRCRLPVFNLAVYLGGSYLISSVIYSYAGIWKPIFWLCLWSLGKPISLGKYVQFCLGDTLPRSA